MVYYLIVHQQSLQKPPFSRMWLVCDANIQMSLPGWVMGGANNSKWGDENNILHTPALCFMSASSYYWMSEYRAEWGESEAKQQPSMCPWIWKSHCHCGPLLTFDLGMQKKAEALP